jgi:hypothetical protein
MGVYGASTFHQGDAVTPDPHPAPKPTSCQTMSTIGNGFIIHGTSIVSSIYLAHYANRADGFFLLRVGGPDG